MIKEKINHIQEDREETEERGERGSKREMRWRRERKRRRKCEELGGSKIRNEEGKSEDDRTREERK